MVTLCNADQSFEYHVKLDQIRKIAFIEKEAPNKSKTLRIVRILNATGESITSLILVDTSDSARVWFNDLIQRHGSEMQL
jgi:putative heme iron utilization protein